MQNYKVKNENTEYIYTNGKKNPKVNKIITIFFTNVPHTNNSSSRISAMCDPTISTNWQMPQQLTLSGAYKIPPYFFFICDVFCLHSFYQHLLTPVTSALYLYFYVIHFHSHFACLSYLRCYHSISLIFVDYFSKL